MDLKSQASSFVVATRQGIFSGAWAYPFIGVTYLASHPSLYRAIVPIILKAVLASAGITVALFFFAYLPQVAFCALFSGPFAFATAAAMVLGEAYALSLIVSKTFFLGPAQEKLFDAVLLQQGNQDLVSQGRVVTGDRQNGFKALGKSLTKPLSRFSRDGLVRYLISLPLNSIPLLGTLCFVVYNGVKMGPSLHARYFQLKRLQGSQREAYVHNRSGEYGMFGTAAFALSLVPFAGIAFGFTNIVGAALWASSMENRSALKDRRDEVNVEL